MLIDKNHFKTMPDYGAGPGPAVHTLHFTECASRLTAVLILPMTACSGGSRPGPVNRHGFEIAGSAGARSAPVTGPAPAGRPLGGWRPVGWKRKPASGGTRDALGAPGRGGRRQRRRPRGAPRGPDPASRVPCPRVRAALSSQRRPRLRKVFPKLSLHRRGSSRIVLLRTGA